MLLKHLEIHGFKSFAKKTDLDFGNKVVCIVGPNGSGKSNIVEAFRFVLGEQSMKSMRGKGGSDLVFKGSQKLPKSSFAKVVVYFDNTNRIFKLFNDNGENVNLNFDLISIGREVYVDGVNKYTLNGNEVRLKDINSLLASINIGSSGHHIISQGEADRILSAPPKERREMIEDALGLKVYQYKIKDSEKKLERSEENMREIVMLRRENAPHLRFLKKQVEKLEQLDGLRKELSILYKEYLKKESFYLSQEKDKLSKERDKLAEKIRGVEGLLQDRFAGDQFTSNAKLDELRRLESEVLNIRRVRSEIERKLGRVEGLIEAEKMRAERTPEVVSVDPEKLQHILDETNDFIDVALSKESLEEVRQILQNIKKLFADLKESGNENIEKNNKEQIDELEAVRVGVLEEMQKIESEEISLNEDIKQIKIDINKEVQAGRDKEREKYELKVHHQELSSALEMNGVKFDNINIRMEAFENELREGEVLIGEEIQEYNNYILDGDIDPAKQEEQRRQIERIKIKLEDSGVGDVDEVMKEYREVEERDQFLEKEMVDLENSINSLVQIIADLKLKISEEFDSGVKKINGEFHKFFELMFGGGRAKLTIVEIEGRKSRNDNPEDEYAQNQEEDENKKVEKGVEIDVSLPNKKVKELHSLSGGERSLTSIALLFAMSSVNPPPFLVLDETDAALDEANSRKYGDMLERLSEYSQLVVVTHNRETMSRANILYGITIGADESSKLLSVKFDEAVSIAK